MVSFKIKLIIILLAATTIILAYVPALAQHPAVVTAEPILYYGSVDGYVLIAGSNVGIQGANVRLINSSNQNTTYGKTLTDMNGHFYFMNVLPLEACVYSLKAEKGIDTGYSGTFCISRTESKTVDVYVHTKPANISLVLPRDYVVANGSDNIPVATVVWDSFGGHPDGTYSSTYGIKPDRDGKYVGSLGAPGNVHVVQDVSANNSSRSKVEYGWAGPDEAGKRAIINVSFTNDPGINASAAIDIRSPDTTPPITRLNASGTPDNAGGFLSNVTVTLTAHDDPGGWGVNATYYRLENEGWALYDRPFTMTRDGAVIVEYYSIDRAGNVEKPKSRTILIHRS